MTSANDLNVARAAGTLAAKAGDDRASCLWESGPLRDAWLAAYDTHACEPLHKVLHGGGPLVINAPAIEGETDDAFVERVEAIVRSHGVDPTSMVLIGGETGQSMEIGEIITLNSTFGGGPLHPALRDMHALDADGRTI